MKSPLIQQWSTRFTSTHGVIAYHILKQGVTNMNARV
jgi:hypothetical protein